MTKPNISNSWAIAAICLAFNCLPNPVYAFSTIPQVYTFNPGPNEVKIALPVTWQPDAFAPPIEIPVVPVNVNNSIWPADQIARAQAALDAWNDIQPAPNFRLQLQAVENITVDLSVDAEVNKIKLSASRNGLLQNHDRISIYWVDAGLEEALMRADDNISASAAGLSSTFMSSWNGLADSPRPHADFGWVLLFSQRGENGGVFPMITNLEFFQTALTHEIGHCLGMTHSTVSSAVMYKETSTGITVPKPLADDDKQEIYLMYAQNFLNKTANVGEIFIQLSNADKLCDNGDISCWQDANLVLVELFRPDDPEDQPYLSGITGWSGEVNSIFFDAIFPGTCMWPWIPAGQSLKVRMRELTQQVIDEFKINTIKVGIPVVGTSWYYNSSDRLHARTLNVPAAGGAGYGDAIGIDGETDGVSTFEEVAQFGTSPTDPDTDGDGQLDGDEISQGTPPLNARPVANAGPDVTAECDGHDLTAVTLNGTASSDREGDPLTFEWTGSFPEGGGTVTGPTPIVSLSKGATTINLRVRDPYDVSLVGVVGVRVIDTKPPTLDVQLDHSTLWPPNHKAILVRANVSVSDVCDPNPTFTLTSISSNEPADAPGDGDGNTAIDIQGATLGTADLEFYLRAERSGTGRGRRYTIVYSAQDDAGNSAMDTAFVAVPHDMNGNPAAPGEGLDNPNILPSEIALQANFPNPFNASTRIQYDLPSAQHVVLEIFDIIGQRVCTLVDEERSVGSHVVTWDGTNGQGVSVASGAYLYRMRADSFTETRKMVLLK